MGHRLPQRRDNKGQRAPRGRERRRESAAGEVKRPTNRIAIQAKTQNLTESTKLNHRMVNLL